MRRTSAFIVVAVFGVVLVGVGLTETGDFFKPTCWPWIFLPGFGYSIFDMGSGLLLGYGLIELLYLGDRRKIGKLGKALGRQEVSMAAADLKLVCWNTTAPIVIQYPPGTAQEDVDKSYNDAELKEMDLLSKDKTQLAKKLDPNLFAGKLPKLFSIRAEKLRTLQTTYAEYFDADFIVLLINLAEYLERLDLHVELVVKERARSGVNLAKMYEDECYNDLQRLLSDLTSASRRRLY